MKTVARFITRLQGDGDGLFVGSLMTGGLEYFKPNTIYEIKDIMGVLTIVETGRATGAGPNNCSSERLYGNNTQFSWSCEIGYILECTGKRLFLTENEHKELCALREVED